jgi:hypothetical protein
VAWWARVVAPTTRIRAVRDQRVSLSGDPEAGNILMKHNMYRGSDAPRHGVVYTVHWRVNWIAHQDAPKCILADLATQLVRHLPKKCAIKDVKFRRVLCFKCQESERPNTGWSNRATERALAQVDNRADRDELDTCMHDVLHYIRVVREGAMGASRLVRENSHYLPMIVPC